MKATNVKRKKVEELSQYGKPLTGLEKEAVKKQEMIFMAEIKKGTAPSAGYRSSSTFSLNNAG